MKKLVITLLGLMAMLLAAQSAQAAPVQGELELRVYGKGKVQAPGFDCGTDCTETVAWDDTQSAPETVLTTIPTAPGWAATSWSGCARFNTERKCVVAYAPGQKIAYVFFNDVQKPRVFIAGFSHHVSQSAHVNLSVSDNERITKLEFLLNGQVMLTQTKDFGDASIDVSELPEGVYDLQLRATDGNHNVGESDVHQIQVDHTPPPVVMRDPVTITNDLNPEFTFDSDETYWGSYCAVQKAGETAELDTCDPGEAQAYPVTSEGEWEFVVRANDGAGNVNLTVHPFVVDRTAPALQFTAGPEEGSTVEQGEVRFDWEASDLHAVTESCAWNAEELVPCDGSSIKDLAPGTHTFAVLATDAAGNETRLTRSVTVQPAPEPDPDPDPEPEPDTSDRTAPEIRLVAPEQSLKTMRRALRLRVTCSEACSGKVTVKGSGLRFRGRVYLVRAGVAKLRLRPDAKAKRKLGKLLRQNARWATRSVKPRPVALTAAASLSDRAGNSGRRSLRFTVPR